MSDPNPEWAATRELLSTEWPTPIKPGLYRGWTYDQYAELRAVRSSDLKGFARSAAHAHRDDRARRYLLTRGGEMILRGSLQYQIRANTKPKRKAVKR